MTDAVQKPSKTYSENPASVARRLARQKASEEKRQNAADLKLSEEQSESGRVKAVKKIWRENLAAQTDTERSKLNSLVDEWNYHFDIMRLTSDAIREDQEYNTMKDDGGIPHRPEEYLAEIEEYVKTHPPIFYHPNDRSPCRLDGNQCRSFFEEITERRIADEGFYFRTYGIGIDGVEDTLYGEFLRYFRMWYRMYRHKLELATTSEYGPEYCRTWEQVDEICLQNPQLKNLVKPQITPKTVAPPLPAPLPTPTPAPTLSTLAEQVIEGNNEFLRSWKP